MWKGKKKAGIYLRRSKGEDGSTKAQLGRILDQIKDLEKSKKIFKIDTNIVGKDIDKEERFDAVRDLAKKGDIFNEGEGASAFDSATERPVLNEMLRRMEEGEYDIIIAESLDRFTRDPLDFARARNGRALDLWRKQGKMFWGLSDKMGLGDKDKQFNEAIIVTQNTWGGAGKKQEIKKSISSLEAKLDRGYIASKIKAELLGSGTKNAGMDYRRFWKIAQAYGENEKGRLNSPTVVGKEFNKDHRWASDTYNMLRDWSRVKIKPDMTALEGWMNVVDALNEYIKQHPREYPANAFKSQDTKNIISNSNGFLNFPAGVNMSETYPIARNQFINFPYPLDFDFAQLSETNKPQIEIEGWAITREPISESEKEKLLKYQTLIMMIMM